MNWIKAQDGALYNLNWVMKIYQEKGLGIKFQIRALVTNGGFCEKKILGEYDSEVQADTALDDLIIKMENVVK